MAVMAVMATSGPEKTGGALADARICSNKARALPWSGGSEEFINLSDGMDDFINFHHQIRDFLGIDAASIEQTWGSELI
jgi:hypothetical protein